LLLIAMAVLVLPAAAGEEEHGHGHDQAHGHDQGDSMSPEMQEMWAKMANPNEHHEHLARMTGQWNVSAKMWTAPGAPATETQGSSHNEMIMDGRFLQSRFEGEFLGQRFMGIGIDGYDNLMQKHVGMWIDTAGTMMLQFVGECSENGKVLSTVTKMTDPMSGQMRKMKGKITLVDDDQ
jgi:hypothetical protein